MPVITANGAELYYEVHGRGSPVLFVGGLAGATFDGLARIVEQAGFMTIVYDRRGNARSPRPPDWSATTMQEQADDAAALLAALGVARAAVVGNSLGALVTLELALRHRDVVTRAVLLDAAPLEHAVANLAQRSPAALDAGGDQRKQLEGFLRFVGAWDALDAAAREPMLATADVFLRIDIPLRASYRPDEARLAANDVPVLVGIGEQSAPPLREMATWLAQHLRVAVTPTPGGHVGYLVQPADIARTILQFLRHP